MQETQAAMRALRTPSSPSWIPPASMEPDAVDASKADLFQASLSNAWAGFLGAQHCTREISSIRRAVDRHIEHVNRTIASLETSSSNHQTQQAVLSTVVTELKSKVDQHATEIDEVALLRTKLATLQNTLTQQSEDASRKVAGLSEKIDVQQTGLASLRSSTAQDIAAMNEQCRLALNKVDSLQAELVEAKTEAAALAQQLAKLENQVKDLAQPQSRLELSEDVVRFLDEMFIQRHSLEKLLDRSDHNSFSDRRAPVKEPTRSITFQAQPAAPAVPTLERPAHDAVRRSQRSHSHNAQPLETTKRKLPDPFQPPPKRPCPAPSPSGDPAHDMRTLYFEFRDSYKANPPKSDTAFIWKFLDSIQDPALSKHVQTSLAALLPQYIHPRRDNRPKNPHRVVSLSRGLTWRTFREGLVKIPGPEP
ncbi:hypothetical protein VTJ83DRAFT_2145 [Remersonia thermophila]|uniref:Uncharacterized protein n=1 Tax=Remersonia thermophila TaxID=72144 RepID=A0ABR4DJE1_9PEZI